MDTIFDDIFASERKRKPAEILAWMRTIREAETTGVLRLFNPPNEKLIFHHYRGRWSSSTLDPDGDSALIDLANDIALNNDMFTKFIQLSTHGLVHSNLLLRAEYQQQENGVRSAELPWETNSSAERTDPYLIKMKWGNASGSILFNGVSNLPHSLYISENLILDEPGISTPILQRKDDPSCVITLFSPDPTMDAWQELRLRRSFKLLCDRMLERSELIAGRAIVETFTQVISSFTASEQIDISILKRQLVNNEFYRSSHEAAGQYRMVFGEFIDHFSAVFGSRLLLSNLREIRLALSSDIRDVLTYYKILPDEYVI